MTVKKYAKTHEWVEVEDGKGRIGITDFAQKELGDVVFVELPEIGDEVKKGESFGTIESVKAASDLYAPVSGEVVEVNNAVVDKPQIVNEDPEGKGWMIVVEMSDPSELDDLMTEEEYKESIEEE
ncbi:MAG: glycine cleavage system protein GcvH [Synergistetes bacterium]|nr:glycine cleavage system protein GcvH [Synergistota bacterium]